MFTLNMRNIVAIGRSGVKWDPPVADQLSLETPEQKIEKLARDQLRDLDEMIKSNDHFKIKNALDTLRKTVIKSGFAVEDQKVFLLNQVQRAIDATNDNDTVNRDQSKLKALKVTWEKEYGIV